MHIVSRKALRVFWTEHPNSEKALIRWFKIVRRTEFENFAALRASFPSADQVGELIVFNIGGNKYRLIASVHFNRGKIFIRHIFYPSYIDAQGVRQGEVETMTIITPDIQEQWSAIAPILTIRNEQEYDKSIERLNALLDEVGTNEMHPLYTLLDTLGIVIQAYEEMHYAIPDSDGVEVLSYLMEEHALSESDLPELGEKATVIDILSRRKALELDQVRALASRFSVSPSVFI